MFHPRLRAFSIAIILLLVGLTSKVNAQTTLGFDPTGVYLDPQGALAARQMDDGKKLVDLLNRALSKQEEKQLRLISLPRLFAQVKTLTEAGKPIPDDLRYLGGITKLQYVFVRPQEKDLIIAGLAEPFDVNAPGRPLGLHTGRPVLQLDDLVVALRTCGPSHEGRPLGCKIDMEEQAMAKMMKTLSNMSGLVKTAPDQRGAVAQAMAKAAGEQYVQFLNLQADSRFAFVTLEADYLLKRLVIGLDQSPVKGVVTYLSTQEKPDPVSNRFWFEVNYEPLLASPAGDAFEIRGQSLRVSTRRHFTDGPDEATASAKQYAQHVTKHLPRLAQAIPAFADLENLSDLSLVAALIAGDKLHEKAQWDMGPVLDEKGFAVAKVTVPKTAQTLVNFKATSRMVLYIGGGVLLDHRQVIKKRDQDVKNELAGRSRNLSDQVSVLVPVK